MAPSTGRHDADESASDRARIDYLAGEPGGELDPIERAELDELRALLADPTLWSEPPAGLADSVVALIAAESGQPAGSPSAATDLDRSAATGKEPEPVVGGVLPAAADPVADVAGPPVAAPDRTLDLAAARRRKDGRQGRRPFTRPVFLIAAAAAVVVVALSAVLLFRGTGSERRFDVALSATDLVPAASGNASMTQRGSGWEIHLDATGLPRLDNGRFYQAWLRNPDGLLVPIGTFNEGADVTLWAGVSPANFPTMTITEESADGNQDSSGQRVLVGTAVEQ